jgi:hypothetical protein
MRQGISAPLRNVMRCRRALESLPPQSVSRNNRRQGTFVILDPRQQQQMDQEQTILLPTAMDWDCDGELCAEDFHRLLDRLQAQDGNAQN